MRAGAHRCVLMMGKEAILYQETPTILASHRNKRSSSLANYKWSLR